MLSGDKQQLEELKAALQGEGEVHAAEGVACLPQPHMQPMLEEFRAAASQIVYKAPQITMVSSVSGCVLEAVDAEYWCQQIVQAVDFVAAITTCAKGSSGGSGRLYLEVGPSPVLSSLGQMCVAGGPGAGLSMWAYSLSGQLSSRKSMLQALAQCYVAGLPISWSKLYGDEADANGGAGAEHGGYRKISLPTYAFQRKRYWLEGLDWALTSAMGTAPLRWRQG